MGLYSISCSLQYIASYSHVRTVGTSIRFVVFRLSRPIWGLASALGTRDNCRESRHFSQAKQLLLSCRRARCAHPRFDSKGGLTIFLFLPAREDLTHCRVSLSRCITTIVVCPALPNGPPLSLSHVAMVFANSSECNFLFLRSTFCWLKTFISFRNFFCLQL